MCCRACGRGFFETDPDWLRPACLRVSGRDRQSKKPLPYLVNYIFRVMGKYGHIGCTCSADGLSRSSKRANIGSADEFPVAHPVKHDFGD